MLKAAISLGAAVILTALGVLGPSPLQGLFLAPSHALFRVASRLDSFSLIVNALTLKQWNWVFLALNALVFWAVLYLVATFWQRHRTPSSSGEESAA